MSTFFKRLLALLALSSLLGQGCTKGVTPETAAASKRSEMNIWAVVDDLDVYQAVIQDFRVLHPNVQINYRRLRLEEYESSLLNALSEDRGPDIFLIHNDWATKYLPKIAPMPPTTKVAYSTVTGTIKQEQTWELRTEPSLTLKQFRDGFADATLKDAVRTVNVSTNPDVRTLQERMVAMPVSVDTLALYYNKDLLNAAGIPTPPETWGQFQEQVKKLTKLDAQGSILQAGAAIGTASNIERSQDIVAVLMAQNGAQLADAVGSPTFHMIPPELSGQRDQPPAYQALEFYTDFANPSKETYTWNATMPNSLDAFIQGRTAFFFGYSYHLDQIKARAPKLNMGITKLPQIEGNPVKNYGNYWMWTVSKKSKNIDMAWNFLNFVAKPEESKKVLDTAHRPAARKSLLGAQLEDERVGVFASQVLTAVTWYRGNNPQAADSAFATMVDDVVSGAAPVNNAVRTAADKVNQTITF